MGIGFLVGVLVNLPGVFLIFVEDPGGGPGRTYVTLAIAAGVFLTGLAMIGSERWRRFGTGVALGTGTVVLAVAVFLLWLVSTVVGG